MAWTNLLAIQEDLLMEFLKGETEARYAWETAALVARKERLALKAARQESLAEVTQRMAASLAASNERWVAAMKPAAHDPWRAMWVEMEEHHRKQREAFLELTRPVPAMDFGKLFPRTVDFKTLLGPSVDYEAVFGQPMDLKAVFGQPMDFKSMFPPLPDYSKLFQTANFKKALTGH